MVTTASKIAGCDGSGTRRFLDAGAKVFLASEFTFTTSNSVYGTFLIVINVLSSALTGNSSPVTVTPLKNT